MPLEVFGTDCGGASTMSSSGAPIRLTASSLILRLIAAWREGSASRVSASTTTRSVPLAASMLPKIATQPLRIPARSPTASSSS